MIDDEITVSYRCDGPDCVEEGQTEAYLEETHVPGDCIVYGIDERIQENGWGVTKGGGVHLCPVCSKDVDGLRTKKGRS